MNALQRLRIQPSSLWLTALAACGSTTPTALDAAVDTVDAAAADAAGACQGTCRTLTATINKAPTTIALDRAFFGYNGGAAAPTSLRIELHHGGDATCPEMTSPTPMQTLIVASIPVTGGAVPTSSTMPKVSLLDFASAVTTSPIVRSTTVTLTNIGWSATGDRYVAFDVAASLDEGISIAGHVFATYCPSLDAP